MIGRDIVTMTRYEKRVQRLREHVLKKQKRTPQESKINELTVAEIKAKLDELGIEYDKKATKAELISLLEAVQGESQEESGDEGAE